MSFATYEPPLFLRNGHVNSLLAASPLRRARIQQSAAILRQGCSEKILHLNNNVRLQVKLNLHSVQHTPQNPVIIFLHGWEGCADSLYILDIASRMHALGYDTVRINYRDHGHTQHLNTGLFHSCRLDEVRNAVIELQGRLNQRPIILIGFSLGGNFALRIAAAPAQAYIIKVIGICPVIDPQHTLESMEHAPAFYQYYFLHRWKQSLKVKARTYPHLYRYGEFSRVSSVRAMTERLVHRYTEYASLYDYLRGYSIAGERLKTVGCVTHLLFSEDDPLIPSTDTALLARNPCLNVHKTQYGGHCGFLGKGLRIDWLQEYVNHCITNNANYPDTYTTL